MFYNVLFIFILLYNSYFFDSMTSYQKVSSIASESRIGEKAQSSPLNVEQNVDFVLSNNTIVDDGYNLDPSRDIQIRSDDRDLNNFFQRPILILSVPWEINTSFHEIIDPWARYFKNDRVENRLTNFKLLRCRLHIRILINGSPFHFGRILTAYHPLADHDFFFYESPSSQTDFVAISQLPSLYLSPTGSHTGEMVLPLILDTDLFDVPSRSWEDNMGRIIMKSVGTLGCASSSPSPVTVSVFAWATDVEMGGLTSVDISAIDPQSNEYSVTPVARVATVVANAMGSFTKFPWIGRYAMATQIGADALSKVATLFGLSKPPILNTTVVVRHAKNGLSSSTGQDDVHKLTIDAKQEVTIDPMVTGSTSVDEMSLLYMAMRKSYLHRFPWSVAQSPESLLFTVLVDPCVVRLQTPGAADCAYSVTPMAAVTYPFKYWRGGIKYHFDVVCSSVHRGRLRIVYEPTPDAGGTLEYNTNTTMIIDLAETQSFEFCVPWTQAHAYRQHVNFGAQEQWMYALGTDPFTPQFTDRVSNGVIYVYVMNALSTSGTTGTTIDTIVSVSACDDFEVASPTSWDLQSIRYYAPYLPLVQYGGIEPESLETTPIKNSRDSDTPSNDVKDAIYFGESVKSSRQMMKRYSVVYSPSLGNSGNNYARFYLPKFPFEGGDRVGAHNPNTFIATRNVGSRYYSKSYMNYVTYFSRFFGCRRGSLRYMIDNTASTVPCNMHVSLVPNYQPISHEYGSNPLVSGDTLSNFTAYYNFMSDSLGLSGDAMSVTSIDPISTFEIPFHLNKRFAFSRLSPAPLDASPDGTFTLTYFSNARDSLGNKLHFKPDDLSTIWVSAGEDYSLSCFIGIPTMFFSAGIYNPPP